VTRMGIDASLQAASGRASAGASSARTSRLLIGAEVALSIILLAGAALLIRSFVALRGVAPGFDPTRVLTFKLSPLPRYSSTPVLWEFERQVLERIRALPGVDTAAVSICLPLELGPLMPAEILGPSPPTPLNPHYRTISPDYFRSLKIPIIHGRSFSDSDTSNSTPAIIINESMARRFFRDRDPLGQHLRLGVGLGVAYTEPPRVIVGVAGDVRESSLDQPAGWTVFIPRAQVPSSLTADINRLVGTSWAVRTGLPPAQLAEAVRRTILGIDPLQPISNIRTMEQMMSMTVDRQRFTWVLMTIFAALGMVLAAVGIYGVISYIVAQRTHEVGIRMALGAERSDVLKMIIRKGLSPALVGIVIGVAGALALARFLSSMLYGVSPSDPLTFGGVAVTLLAIALLACYIPARRATLIDPMVALRHE
jgi:putative ABC transport system permease protein